MERILLTRVDWLFEEELEELDKELEDEEPKLDPPPETRVVDTAGGTETVVCCLRAFCTAEVILGVSVVMISCTIDAV